MLDFPKAMGKLLYSEIRMHSTTVSVWSSLSRHWANYCGARFARTVSPFPCDRLSKANEQNLVQRNSYAQYRYFRMTVSLDSICMVLYCEILASKVAI
jgi:hypothetical protein